MSARVKGDRPLLHILFSAVLQARGRLLDFSALCTCSDFPTTVSLHKARLFRQKEL